MPVPARDARRALRRPAGPRRRVRARRDAARVRGRLRSRRPRDPDRGRGRCRPAARPLPAAPRARSAATARWRRPRAACSARAPTGCRRCAVARGVFWGEDRVGDAAATARLHAAAADALSLRGDQPREDLLVERLARLASRPRAGVAQDRVVPVGLAQQQIEVGVGDLVFGSAIGSLLSSRRRS